MKDLNSIDWAEAIARLHPVLLHLPVGLFVALAWLWCWNLFRRSEDNGHAGRAPVVWLLALITPLAATSGWLLHEGASYPDPVEWHEWFGIGLMVVAICVLVAHLKRSKYYAPLMWLGFLLLFPTAHFGGTLTHGEGFLTDPWLETQSIVVSADANAVAFEDVLPILEARCANCHGEHKQRGGLRVDDLDALLAGGDSGPAVVPGDASKSLLLSRLRLPLDHDEHMPPASKTQPTTHELQWIEAWIGGGEAPVEVATPEITSEPAATLALEDERVVLAIAALRERLAHVQPTAFDSDRLWIDFTAAQISASDTQALLGPLKEVVSELSLAGKTIEQSDLKFLATMRSLETLDLRRLAQAELQLAPLANSQSIRTLNLAGTKLTSDSIGTLAEMPQLERVYLWGTGLESEIDALSEARPTLTIIGASPPSDEPLEVEPEVKFEKSPPPEAKAVPLTPANMKCPVTDQPVDARYTILFEGRAIGFCCPNCPKTFWNDPQAFLDKLED